MTNTCLEGWSRIDWNGVANSGVANLNTRGGEATWDTPNGNMSLSPFGSRLVLFNNLSNRGAITLRHEFGVVYCEARMLTSGADEAWEFFDSKFVGDAPGVNAMQVQARVRGSNGSIEFWVGGVIKYASPNNTFTPGTCPLIGIEISVSSLTHNMDGSWTFNPDGALSLQVDGVAIATVGSIVTLQSNHSQIDQIRFPALPVGDIRITDAGFLGEGRVPAGLWPTSDDGVAFTSSSGTPNYQNVDTSQDTPVKWNASSTATQADFFVAGGISGVEAVLEGTVFVQAWKSDTDVRKIQIALKIGGTVYQSGVDEVLSTNPVWFSYTWSVNPATGTAWTPSTLNAADIGYILTA